MTYSIEGRGDFLVFEEFAGSGLGGANVVFHENSRVQAGSTSIVFAKHPLHGSKPLLCCPSKLLPPFDKFRENAKPQRKYHRPRRYPRRRKDAASSLYLIRRQRYIYTILPVLGLARFPSPRVPMVSVFAPFSAL